MTTYLGPQGRKLLLVEWVDSCRQSEWRGISEAAKYQGAVRCVSVGWLVAECAETITLASSAARHAPPQQDGICGEMEIPKRAVLRRHVLRGPGGKS